MVTALEKYKAVVLEIVDCNNRRNLAAEELRLIEAEHAELLRQKADIQVRLDLEILKESKQTESPS